MSPVHCPVFNIVFGSMHMPFMHKVLSFQYYDSEKKQRTILYMVAQQKCAGPPELARSVCGAALTEHAENICTGSFASNIGRNEKQSASLMCALTPVQPRGHAEWCD